MSQGAPFAMPLAWTLLLLWGLGGPGSWGCLQCDPSVVDALSQLRRALIPKHFHQEQLRDRAEALLLGMEGPFFRDYAFNAFVGNVGAYWRWEGRDTGSRPPPQVRKAGVPGQTSLWFPANLPGMQQLKEVASFVKNQMQHLMVTALEGSSAACPSLHSPPCLPGL